MSIGGFLWTLGAQAWRTRSCCNINICIVYQLPTFWEFSKFPKCWQLIYNTNIYIYILHQLKLYIEGCLCALRAQGSVTYIFFIHILILDRSCQHLGIYILDISCQLLGDMCQLEGFCPRAQLSGAQLSTLKKVDSWAPDSWAPGPNCPGPNCPPWKKWTVGPRTVRPWNNV